MVVCICRQGIYRSVLQFTLDRIPADRRILLRLQLGHIFRGELKIIQRRILLDPRRRDALGQRDEAFLQAPPEQDLSLGLAVLLGQLHQCLLAPALALHDRRIGLAGDIPLREPLDDVVARAPRVDLVLADGDDAAVAPLGLELGDVLLELVKVVDAVVADADGAELALLDRLDEGLPGALARRRAAVGRVEEHQVHVLDAGGLEALLDLGFRALVPAGLDDAGGDFGGEEDLGAR